MGADTAPDGARVTLGVLVPCRNEARVIERRLLNLALCRWPGSARPHRIVVVDDGSEDETAERARAGLTSLEGLPAVVGGLVANAERPGKPGAIARGLETLGEEVDVVVLTDADVILEPDALVEIAEAFARDADLALATGTQRFVHELPEDGSTPGVDLDNPSPSANSYDRFSEAVRRFESRRGLCFSVHGQLLAWRTGTGLRPTPGVAADDLDLVLQVRSRESGPRAVRLVESAAFLETKTPPGDDADRQALRRARAYVQALTRHGTPRHDSLPARLQWLLYRHVVPRLFGITALGAALLVLVAGLAGGWLVGALAALGVLFAALTIPGRRWIGLVLLIREAVRCEAEGTLSEQWEMARS